jgi:hypothetical protein
MPDPVPVNDDERPILDTSKVSADVGTIPTLIPVVISNPRSL